MVFCNRFIFECLMTFDDISLVDIFYVKFRICEPYTVTNSVTRILLSETLSNVRTIKC